MNEEEIKKLVKEYMEDYFRMSRPGFEIASNFMTEGHSKAEFCITTDTSQGLHFYEQGNCKFVANKSVEIRSGYESKEDEFSIVISAENGDVKIKSIVGDLILEGQNVQIRANAADGELSLNSSKLLSVDTSELLVQSTKSNVSSTSDTAVAAGTLSLYCETGSVSTSSGQDPIIGPNLISTITNIADKARRLIGIV